MGHGMRVGYPGGYMGGSPGGGPSPTMAQGYLGGSMRGRRTDFGDDGDATGAAASAAASAATSAAADNAGATSANTGMASDMAGQPSDVGNNPAAANSMGAPAGVGATGAAGTGPSSASGSTSPAGDPSISPADEPTANINVNPTPWSPPPPMNRAAAFMKGIFSPTPANIGSLALFGMNPSPLGALMAAIKGAVGMANNDIGQHAMNAGMTDADAANSIAGQVAGVQGAAGSTGVGQGGPSSGGSTMPSPTGSRMAPRPLADNAGASPRDPDPSSPLIDQNDYIKRRFGGLTVGT